MELSEWFAELEEEKKKKNFRNFVGKFFGGSVAGYHPYHVLTHPWILLDEAYSQVKWAWQRVFRGWDDRVVWSIDMYLAERIPQWLDRLKTKKAGIPMRMFRDEDYVGENYEVPDEIFEKRTEEYNEILEKISLGFRFYDTLQNDVVYDHEEEKAMIEYFNKVSFPLFVEYFSTFWD